MALLDEILEIQSRVLQGSELPYVEWILPSLDFVSAVILDFHGSPCSAGQEYVAVLSEYLLRNANSVIAQRRHSGPIMIAGLVEAHSKLTQKSILSVLFDTAFDQFFLRTFGV